MKADIKNVIEIEKRLYNYTGEDRILSCHDIAKALRESEDDLIQIEAGISTLDKLINGFQGGELTVISGITGNGKTLLAQTLTQNFSNQGIKSLWFSYEVLATNFLKSFGEDLPLFYMPARLTGNSLTWLKTRIHEARLKYDVRAVFVDHLHFLIEMSRGNLSMEIGTVMRTLKKLALQFKVAFFIVAHTMKIKSENELGLGDTRDSSFIEQESDNVLYIWRTSVERQAILKIAKNRRNGVFEKKIILYKTSNFLEELPKND